MPGNPDDTRALRLPVFIWGMLWVSRGGKAEDSEMYVVPNRDAIESLLRILTRTRMATSKKRGGLKP